MADFSALKTSIQNYIKQNGNNEITGTILQQILLSMVTALGDNAINDLVTALGDEVSARQNADGTLQDNIDDEATARSQADGTLQQNINSEAAARQNADGTLQTNINNEATARESADGTLQTNINNEATARSNADTQLGNRITSEAEAREGADNNLRGFIDGIIGNIGNGYVYAGIATPSTTPASGKVFYLALTAGTYTNFGATVVPQGVNILKFNGSAWSLDTFVGIDDIPTPSSNKLVKSGGVYSALNKNLDDLTNLYADTTWSELGKGLNNRGEVVDDPSYPRARTSDYIAVEPNTTYTSSGLIVLCFYDSEKVYKDSSWSSKFTTPADAAYVRIELIEAVNRPFTPWVVKGDYNSMPDDIGRITSKNVSFDGKDIIPQTINGNAIDNNSITEEKTSFIDTNIDYFENVSYEENKAINPYGYITESTGWFLTDHIILPPGEYKVSLDVTIIGYRKDGFTYAYPSSSLLAISNGVFTVPSNCYSIRVCYVMSGLSNLHIYKPTVNPIDFGKIRIPSLRVNRNNLDADVLSVNSIPLSSIFAPLAVYTGTPKKIKLIGDSITYGMGASDSTQSDEVIAVIGGETYYRSTTQKSWAAKFKAYFEDRFNCSVTNNGISGTKSDFLVTNWNSLVDNDDDIIICAIGTNDRSSNTKAGLYANLIQLSELAAAQNSIILFSTGIPTTAELELYPNFTTYDVANVVYAAATASGYQVIDMYNRLENYLLCSGTSIGSVLRDGIHPNDTGYDIMFKLTLSILGLGYNVSE